MWVRTPQPGLWFTGGVFSQCRVYSCYIALQIDAIEAGKLAKELIALSDGAKPKTSEASLRKRKPTWNCAETASSRQRCSMGRSIHFARRAGEILWSLRCAVRRRS